MLVIMSKILGIIVFFWGGKEVVQWKFYGIRQLLDVK